MMFLTTTWQKGTLYFGYYKEFLTKATVLLEDTLLLLTGTMAVISRDSPEVSASTKHLLQAKRVEEMFSSAGMIVLLIFRVCLEE